MDDFWKEKYQAEDEERALAMALELSRKEYEQSQPESRRQQHTEKQFQMPQVHDNDGEKALSRTLAQTALDTSDVDSKSQADLGSNHQLTHISVGGVSSKPEDQLAIPLCLPNNCTWDSEAGKYIQTGEERRSLCVVEEALEKLRKIKGPVCVTSIVGPYRKGKSYALSEAFDQPKVFPLGHSLAPETMGIWLWIVPKVFKDSRGQEFSVVLLDSEGIDSVTGEGYDDNQIFTLTVLLASVLIYNSQGVPTRTDLDGLKYIAKLSQRIEVQSKTKDVAGKTQEDSKLFHKTFPFFIWLLRDVNQDLPPDCRNIKDYFLKMVFKVHHSSSAENQDGQKVADSILGYFSGFEAFSLPSPTAEKELLKRINDNKSQMNPSFFPGFDEFKRLLENKLTPKKSVNEGELVTGEGLAALVQLYVEAINTPGVIPNVQNAWETFVKVKSSEAIKGAVEQYEMVMKSNLKGEHPCDDDELRKFHGTALEKSEGYFMTETVGISTSTTENYLKKLKDLLSKKLMSWQTRNAKLTTEFCNDLLIRLKQNYLDPVLRRLQEKEAAKMSFDEIIGGYNQIKEDYHNSAIGAKGVIAEVFYKFHPTLLKEQEQYLGLLRQLKDYDEELAQELTANAYQEQERQRLEEEQERLRQENLAVKKEMKMLGRKQHEERKKFREQMESELKTQREQMNNMMEANMKQAKQEREVIVEENQALKNRFLAIQKAHEDNFKMIEKLSDLVAKQDEEKRRLSEQIKKAQAASERQEKVREEMEERHKQEKDELRREMEAKMEKDLQDMTEKHKTAEKMHAELIEQMKTQAVKERNLIGSMRAEHKQQQEDLRRDLEEKRNRDLENMRIKFQATAAAREQQMQQMQENIDRVEEELAGLRKQGFFRRLFGCSIM